MIRNSSTLLISVLLLIHSISIPTTLATRSRNLSTFSLNRRLKSTEGKGKSKGTGDSSAKSTKKSAKGEGKGKAGKDGAKSSKKSKSKGKSAIAPSAKGTAIPTRSPTIYPKSASTFASASSSADSRECFFFPYTHLPLGSNIFFFIAARPPSPIPPVSIPSHSPLSTSTPGVSSILQHVKVPQFALSYTLVDNLMPSRDDYLEIETVTATFFSEYVQEALAEITEVTLVQFITTLETSKFQSGQPVHLVFNSTASFSETSTSIPSPDALILLLQSAIVETTGYLHLLAALGSANAFSTTTQVEFSDPSVADIPVSQANRTKSPAGIAAAAVGGTLLVTGFVLYRLAKADNEQVYYESKDLNNAGYGGSTIAGDTYSGETYDGTITPPHFLSEDEEEGRENTAIDQESTEYDSFSVRNCDTRHCSSVSDEIECTERASDTDGEFPCDEMETDKEEAQVFQTDLADLTHTLPEFKTGRKEFKLDIPPPKCSDTSFRNAAESDNEDWVTQSVQRDTSVSLSPVLGGVTALGSTTDFEALISPSGAGATNVSHEDEFPETRDNIIKLPLSVAAIESTLNSCQSFQSYSLDLTLS